MAGKFEMYKSQNGQYYFHLKAGNGQIILSSEMYSAKSGCQNGIGSVKINAPYDNNYEIRVAANIQYYFVLKAVNGQVIGTSETYVARQSALDGIQSVKSNAPTAQIYDYA